jgi:SAM-dependent methyltransferase
MKRGRAPGAGSDGPDRRSVERTRDAYERIPYLSHPWTSCRPPHLETIAWLQGLSPAPADRSRVLELGCGDGGNLLPLAVAHPGAHFVGVDLAPVHIRRAEETAKRLDLSNVELAAASFADWGGDQAPFDYVIAHGLISWVTPALQTRLLAACRRLLAPNGIAFVSYNTRPGWALQHAIRDLLRHHARDVADLEEAYAKAGHLLDALVATVPERESAYRTHVESIAAVARSPARRHYFAHEYLEDENHPFYVRDFVERAEEHGLAYVGDADWVDAELDNMPGDARDRLAALARDTGERRQILDYVVNRKFRQSLLCPVEADVRPDADWSRLADTHVSAPLRTDDDLARVPTDAVMRFADRHGRVLEIDQPVAKAALARFIEVSPQPVAFEALLDWAWSRIGARPAPGSEQAATDRTIVGLVLGRLITAGMAEAQRSPPAWALEPGERPKASPLVREAIRVAGPASSLRHTTVALDAEPVRAVLALLDGSRDRAALARSLAGRVEAGEIEDILAAAARNALLLP